MDARQARWKEDDGRLFLFLTAISSIGPFFYLHEVERSLEARRRPSQCLAILSGSASSPAIRFGRADSHGAGNRTKSLRLAALPIRRRLMQ